MIFDVSLSSKDADRRVVNEFSSPEEMLKSDLFMSDDSKKRIISFDDNDDEEEDGEEDTVAARKKIARGLAEGESIGKSVETLSQYYMMVTITLTLTLTLTRTLKGHVQMASCCSALLPASPQEQESCGILFHLR